MIKLKICIFLLLIFLQHSYAQLSTILIVNIDNQCIENVNAVFSNGFSTNSNNFWSIFYDKKFTGSVLFTHVGYEILN